MTTQEIFNMPDKRLMVDQEPIKKAFVNTLSKIHGKSEIDAEMIFEKESLYFKKALTDSQKLAASTGISLYSAFLEIAITGLSIQPGNKSEAYLEARSAKDGDKWIQNARLVITAYGELNMRIMAGQIIRISNPQVIYDGDTFQPRTNKDGVLVVDYVPRIPRRSNKIIGCYVHIVLPNNQNDFKWLLEDDIQRLARYSIPTTGENPRANKLYTSNNNQIDPGFLEAKTIKHAFRAYTKLRVSDIVAFEDDCESESERTSEDCELRVTEEARPDVREPVTEAPANRKPQNESTSELDDDCPF
ncbi:MAG: hypothetical protein LBR26_16010 [Prevotella sp.]|jgi:recombinational DNA repair protein RecT|nr:hypothetical protein [Prevotella sp.]